MFYLGKMQPAFDFARNDLSRWLGLLKAASGDPLPVPRRTPLGQLIKSMLSGRTRDAVSKAAYDALIARYPRPCLLVCASVETILSLVAPVTFADAKAANIVAALARIGRERPDFDLAFLGRRPLAEALAWLECLPGVARKVSASALNASTLAMPVLIVDTHVLRVLKRLGFVRGTADYRVASEAVTAAVSGGSGPGWSGDDFLAFHILVKRLGQTTCRWDVPACGRCPLAGKCPTAGRRAWSPAEVDQSGRYPA